MSGSHYYHTKSCDQEGRLVSKIVAEQTIVLGPECIPAWTLAGLPILLLN